MSGLSITRFLIIHLTVTPSDNTDFNLRTAHITQYCTRRNLSSSTTITIKI